MADNLQDTPPKQMEVKREPSKMDDKSQHDLMKSQHKQDLQKSVDSLNQKQLSLKKSQQSLDQERVLAVGSREGGTRENIGSPAHDGTMASKDPANYEVLPTQGDNVLLQENKSPGTSPAARSMNQIDDQNKDNNYGVGTNASTVINQYN